MQPPHCVGDFPLAQVLPLLAQVFLPLFGICNPELIFKCLHGESGAGWHGGVRGHYLHISAADYVGVRKGRLPIFGLQ
jgi:hypothetical protein